LPESKFQTVEFQDETTGTAIPDQFVPAIEKGFRQSLEKGLLSGNRITGINFRLQDGKYEEKNYLCFILHKF